MQLNKILLISIVLIALFSSFNSYAIESDELEEFMKDNGMIDKNKDYAVGYEMNLVFNSQKGVKNIHLLSAAFLSLIFVGGTLRLLINLILIAANPENEPTLKKRSINLLIFMIMGLTITTTMTIVLAYYR